MRIVYLHQYFNTPNENGSTRSYEFAVRLAARGHDVHVVTSDRSATGSNEWSVSEVDGFQVHRRSVVYDNSMSPVERLRAFAKFALSSARLARRLNADIVYATSTPLTIILPAWYATAGKSTPLVFEVRDSWPTVPIALGYLNNPIARLAARALERWAYKRSDHVVALSPGMRDDAVAHGANSTMISVIPNASDIELFDVSPDIGRRWRESNGVDQAATLVVYTGTFGAANGVEYLVDLAREAVKLDPSIIFALIGGGAKEPSVRARATEFGLLGGCVRILPPVPKNMMPAVLSAADITTSVVIDNPAMNANSANKFFDALAAGRAIAINHGGWQADLIRERGVGLVLERDDLIAAAEQLAALTNDPDALSRAHDRARELALDQFSRDDLAVQLAELLESLSPA